MPTKLNKAVPHPIRKKETGIHNIMMGVRLFKNLWKPDSPAINVLAAGILIPNVISPDSSIAFNRCINSICVPLHSTEEATNSITRMSEFFK